MAAGEGHPPGAGEERMGLDTGQTRLVNPQSLAASDPEIDGPDSSLLATQQVKRQQRPDSAAAEAAMLEERTVRMSPSQIERRVLPFQQGGGRPAQPEASGMPIDDAVTSDNSVLAEAAAQSLPFEGHRAPTQERISGPPVGPALREVHPTSASAATPVIDRNDLPSSLAPIGQDQPASGPEVDHSVRNVVAAALAFLLLLVALAAVLRYT